MERALAAADRGVAALRSLRYTFKDARGVDRPCEVVRRFRKWGWRRGLPDGLRKHLDGVERTLPRAMSRRVTFAVVGCLQFVPSILLLWTMLRPGGVLLRHALLTAAMSGTMAVYFVMLARRRHGDLNELAAIALVLHTADAGFCPGCLYDLSAAPRQEDGVCVCPECGGAWRIGVAGQR
jgi:hypothetical protein